MVYFEAGVLVVVVDLAFGGLDALSDFDEELIDIVFEEFGCFFVAGGGYLVFFDIEEDESDVLYDGEDEMFGAIVPVFGDVLS